MQTKLDKLLASISPERVIVETFNRANEAINTFPVESALIQNWEEFKHFIGKFLRHIDRYTLRLRGSVDISPDDYWSQSAERVLRDVYGSSGQKAAFDMARTGVGGGLYDVLRSVAMHVGEDYAKREIQAKVGLYLEGLTIDQQLEASSEYIAKHGHLLPSEMTEASAARLRAEFPRVLQKHPWLVLKIRNVVR